jgi:hypothetical protein
MKPAADYATRTLRETMARENRSRTEFLRAYEEKDGMSEEPRQMKEDEATAVLHYVGLEEPTFKRVRGVYFVKVGQYHRAALSMSEVVMGIVRAELDRQAHAAQPPFASVESNVEEAERRQNKAKPKGKKEDNEPPSD